MVSKSVISFGLIVRLTIKLKKPFVLSFRTLYNCERLNAFCTNALEREMEVYNFDKKKIHASDFFRV